jgi:hypothetical protein
MPLPAKVTPALVCDAVPEQDPEFPWLKYRQLTVQEYARECLLATSSVIRVVRVLNEIRKQDMPVCRRMRTSNIFIDISNTKGSPFMRFADCSFAAADKPQVITDDTKYLEIFELTYTGEWGPRVTDFESQIIQIISHFSAPELQNIGDGRDIKVEIASPGCNDRRWRIHDYRINVRFQYVAVENN